MTFRQFVKECGPTITFLAAVVIGTNQLWEHELDKFQKPFDIREYKKTGKPLVGTLRQRRRIREADDDEKRNGPYRREVIAREQEWKQISELK